MSESKNVDYLSQLPPEQLKEIFNEVQHSKEPLIGPLAKKFIPFQQEPLFHRVSIHSYSQLDKFCKAAQSNPKLMKHVYHFLVDIDSDHTSSSFWEAEDPFVPSSESITRCLFPSLVEVRDVCISGSSRLTSLFLRPEVAASSFPKVSFLDLDSTFSELDDPFSPSNYLVLPYYTGLKELTIKVHRNAESIRVSSKAILPPVVELETDVRALRLSGPLTASKTSVKRLLSSLGSLEALVLEDKSDDSAIFEILESSASRYNVETLELYARNMHSSPPNAVDVLPSFSALTALGVGGAIPSADPSFYKALRSLPLEILAFTPDATVDLNELTRLVKGPTKLSTLEAIYLNNISKGKVGTRIEDVGAPYAGENGGECMVHPDWELPKWTNGLTRRGLEKFARVAGRNRIRVHGGAINALEVEDEYEEEEEILRALSEFESNMSPEL